MRGREARNLDFILLDNCLRILGQNFVFWQTAEKAGLLGGQGAAVRDGPALTFEEGKDWPVVPRGRAMTLIKHAKRGLALKT
jgi:hypothetical protein